MRASEENRNEALEEEDLPLEKNDLPALYISGFLMIGIPSLLLIDVIIGVTLLLFGR